MSERQRILKLLEEKKITADEASRLLDALGEESGSGRAKFLKVKVFDRSSSEPKVNVTLPVSIVRWGMQFVPDEAREKMNERNIDFDRITDALEHDFIGKLIEVEGEKDHERVEVYLE
jgi:DUF4097 and DUF4098 domain-containing protein YvlB